MSPTFGEYTVVWPAESEKQDQQLIDRLGLFFSTKLACPVLAVLNHDDDILWYGLYALRANSKNITRLRDTSTRVISRQPVAIHSSW